MKDIIELREEINKTDCELVGLFKKRMAVAAEVAEFKRENSMPVYDAERERELLERIALMAGEEMREYALELYSTVLDVSKKYQNDILDSEK